jgi:hypothetical protein
MCVNNGCMVNFSIFCILFVQQRKAAAGFAPANSGFADRRLATWLYRLVIFLLRQSKSGRRDLNPRPSPWQGDAPPLSYSRIVRLVYTQSIRSQQPRNNVVPGLGRQIDYQDKAHIITHDYHNLRPGMVQPVYFFQVFTVNMGVDLSCRNIRMTQKFLHDPQISAAL